MENNSKKINIFFSRWWHWIAFLILTFFSLSFLIFQDGLWTYLDLNYDFLAFGYESRLSDNLFHVLSSWATFGYDSAQLNTTRFINIFSEVVLKKIFSPDFYQIFYFFIFFLISFVIFKKCFRIVFDDRNTSHLAALLLTFNPISFFFLNKAGFFFVYFSLPLIVYSFVKYFSNNTTRFKYLILFLTGSLLLISYARIAFIYFIALFSLGVIYYKQLFSIINLQKKKLFLLLILTFFFLVPVFFSFIYPYMTGDVAYFSGISNYAEAFSKFGNNFYDHAKKESFVNGFMLVEIYNNFARIFQSSVLFITTSLVYFGGVAIYALFLLKKNHLQTQHKKLIILSVVLFFSSIFLKTLAHFTSADTFIKITYKYLPFLASSTNWILLLFLVSFAAILSFVYSNINNLNKKILFSATFLYIILSMSPLIFYNKNDALATTSYTDLPTEYRKVFLNEKQGIKDASLFFPMSPLYFNWSRYPIYININGNYPDLLTDNVRIVNEKQSRLYKDTYAISPDKKLQNLSILNLKNVFVFKDIRNATANQFDSFSAADYKKESGVDYQLFLNSSDWTALQDNKNFAQFQPKDAFNFSYSLYSPKNILKSSVDNFLLQNIDIKSRPILIDKKAFHKPENIDAMIIPIENQNIKVDIKSSPENTTKYYLKFSNIDTSKPFLLQLNQTFGFSWKLHWVNRSIFDEKNCINSPVEYAITNNSVCNYKSGLFELGDARLIHWPEVKDLNHFEGNLIGNAWIINPEDIPAQMRGQKELYAVLIYEKQVYYSYSLLISGITFLILLLLTAWQEIKFYKNRKTE